MYIYEVMPPRVIMPSSRTMDSLKKNSSTLHEEASLELLVRGVQETTRIIQAVAIFFGCLPEIEDKDLLLKT